MTNQTERAQVLINRAARTQLIGVCIIVALGCVAIVATLAFAGSNLSDGQRWLLVAFLIIFTIAGLGFSSWLIQRHNQKLALANSDFNSNPMTPEQQRRKLNLGISVLAAQIPENQRGNLRTSYLVAEDLALRQIEIENNLPLMRHTVLEGVPFSGVGIKEERVYCVEVNFLVKPDIPQEQVDALLNKVEYAAQRVHSTRPGSKIRLLLALVTQFSPDVENRLRSALASKFSHTPVDIDIRFLNFANLQTAFIKE